MALLFDDRAQHNSEMIRLIPLIRLTGLRSIRMHFGCCIDSFEGNSFLPNLAKSFDFFRSREQKIL